MSFLDNVKSEKTREVYKKAIKHFTLKKMDKNKQNDQVRTNKSKKLGLLFAGIALAWYFLAIYWIGK